MAYKSTTKTVTNASGKQVKVKVGSKADIEKYGGSVADSPSASPAQTSSIATSPASVSAPRLSFEEADSNLSNGGLTGNALTMARNALKGSYAIPTVSAETSVADAASPDEPKDDYVPRFFKTESTTTEPEDVETIQRRMSDDAQGEINSLRDYERTLLQERATINNKDDRSTQSRNVMNGLSGSSEADEAQQTTTEKGRQANERIRASVEMQVQGVLSQIRKDAVVEARAQRGDVAADLQNKAARQELASKNLANLAASGVTFDGLRKTSPKEFEYLARQFGSTDALKGAFVLNTPQDQILDKRIEGGKYVIAKQNPLTGKVTVESVDLGLPEAYTKTVDAGDRILAIPDGWDGDPSKLITISKGLSPASANSGGSGLSSKQYTALNQITTRFQADPIINLAIRGGTAAQIADQVIANPGAATSQLKSLYVLVKNLDPDSAVREGELALANQTQSYTQQFGNTLARISEGRVVDPKAAVALAEATKELMAAWNNTASKRQKQYESQSNALGIADDFNSYIAGSGLGYNQTGGDLRSRVEAAGYDFDAMRQDGLTDAQIEASL